MEALKLENKCITNHYLIDHQPDIDKIYLNGKNPYESKYQLLISKCECVGLKHYNDSCVFIEYTNDMDDIYKNITEPNLNKEHKILIVFDDIIADSLAIKTSKNSDRIIC